MGYYQKTNEVTHWNSLIEEEYILDKKYRIIPLINSDMLHDESDEVQHCVRSYASVCSRGGSRIFGIRPLTDETRGVTATLEISLENNTWELRQLRGVRNHSIPDGVRDSLKDIVNRYNTIWTSTPITDENPQRHRSWVVLRDKEESDD